MLPRASLTECLGKVAMLELLKAEGDAWKAILACKMAKEDTKAFEKKVKNQFSLVPLEDITPAVVEVDLEPAETAAKEVEENWGTVVETSLGEEQEEENKIDDADVRDEDDVTVPLEGNGIADTNGDTHEDDILDETEPVVETLHLSDVEEHEEHDESVSDKDNLDVTVPLVDSIPKENGDNHKDDKLDETEPFLVETNGTNGSEADGSDAVVTGAKRKKKTIAGPASKVMKTDSEKSEDAVELTALVDEPKKADAYTDVLSGSWKIDGTDFILADCNHSDVQSLDRETLVFNLDKTRPEEFYQEYFGELDNFEGAYNVVKETSSQSIYIVTFGDSASAQKFLDTDVKLEQVGPGPQALRKVAMRQFARDHWCQEEVRRARGNECLLGKIEAKIDFQAKRKAGVTQGHCVVATLRGPHVEETDLLDGLPEEVEELEMVNQQDVTTEGSNLKIESFVLIFNSDTAAIKFAETKSQHKFKGSPMKVSLLTNLLTLRRFSKKAKNFKDDPSFSTADSPRRVVVPGAGPAAERHLRAGRLGLESVLLPAVPQQAGPDADTGFAILAFEDQKAAIKAVLMREEDVGVMEHPERMMLLTEYLQSREEALTREQGQSEPDIGEEFWADLEGSVETEDTNVDTMDTNVDMDQDTAEDRVVATTDLETVVGCEGFTQSDCDVEEYFEENHEHVEQVWQRAGLADASQVYVRFRDRAAAQRFLTLHYVRYRGRALRPFAIAHTDTELVKYLQ
jgi:hypothetical protein